MDTQQERAIKLLKAEISKWEKDGSRPDFVDGLSHILEYAQEEFDIHTLRVRDTRLKEDFEYADYEDELEYYRGIDLGLGICLVEA